MRKLIITVSLFFLLASFCVLRGGVFFDFDVNPMFFQGEASPGTGISPPMNIVYSFGGGLTFQSARIGLVFHSSNIANAFRINFADRTSEEFALKIQGMGLSVGYVREPFLFSMILSPASFTVLSPTQMHSSQHYEIGMKNEWGLIAPVTAGCKWRIFYLGCFVNFIDWSSAVNVDKYESPAPYHWYLADSQHIDCAIKGFGIGFSLGMRLKI